MTFGAMKPELAVRKSTKALNEPLYRGCVGIVERKMEISIRGLGPIKQKKPHVQVPMIS